MRFVLTLIVLFLTSCTEKMNITEFKDAEPRFVLEDYFNGQVKAWGLFHDRFGNLKRSFKVDIKGTIDNNELILDEKFLYNDGEEDQRISPS